MYCRLRRLWGVTTNSLSRRTPQFHQLISDTAVASAAAPPRPRRVTPRATAEKSGVLLPARLLPAPADFFPFQSLFGGRW
jgi:hypothetical protein